MKILGYTPYGWKSLCKFLSKKIPKENFPIENRFVDKN